MEPSTVPKAAYTPSMIKELARLFILYPNSEKVPYPDHRTVIFTRSDPGYLKRQARRLMQQLGEEEVVSPGGASKSVNVATESVEIPLSKEEVQQMQAQTADELEMARLGLPTQFMSGKEKKAVHCSRSCPAHGEVWIAWQRVHRISDAVSSCLEQQVAPSLAGTEDWQTHLWQLWLQAEPWRRAIRHCRTPTEFYSSPRAPMWVQEQFAALKEEEKQTKEMSLAQCNYSWKYNEMKERHRWTCALLNECVHTQQPVENGDMPASSVSMGSVEEFLRFSGLRFSRRTAQRIAMFTVGSGFLDEPEGATKCACDRFRPRSPMPSFQPPDFDEFAWNVQLKCPCAALARNHSCLCCPDVEASSSAPVLLPRPSSCPNLLFAEPGVSPVMRDAEARTDPEVVKFWLQRYNISHKYDMGFLLDRESWYSVTRESLAEHHAMRFRGRNVVVDAFCGAGGNAIQLARECHRVVAVDMDPVKVALARHNAKLYGVAHKIDFIVGDVYRVLDQLAKVDKPGVDGIFLSPPWGGPERMRCDVFDLWRAVPLDLKELMRCCRVLTRDVALFLPKRTDVEQLMRFAEVNDTMEIEQNWLGDHHAITAYFGTLIWQS